MKRHDFIGRTNSSPCKHQDEEGAFCGQLVDGNMHRPSMVKPDASAFIALATVEQGTEGQVPATVAFAAHSEVVMALVRKKDAAYGGAWQEQGYMGNLARIMSKTARLKNMLWRDAREDVLDPASPHNTDETVLDTLHDLMALAAFMASNIEEGNRWGR